jgi:Zn-finger protein
MKEKEIASGFPCAEQPTSIQPCRSKHQPDMNGASIINAQGCEIPITESMVAQVLDELAVTWQQQRSRATRRMLNDLQLPLKRSADAAARLELVES